MPKPRVALALSLASFGALLASFVACSGGSSAPPATSGDAPPATAAATAVTTTDAPTGSAPDPTATAAPLTGADACLAQADPSSPDAPMPDGGLPTINAGASDAGSDRIQSIYEVVQKKRPAFRCCFDLWGAQNPGQTGTVSVKLDLKPDGSVRGVEVVEAASSVKAQEVRTCMLDVAKKLSYPKSPSGKDTTYTHPFEFKARK
jgi:hypothetical protein